MKISIMFVPLLLIPPITSMAQSSQTKTRDEVRNELAQLRAAGYDPTNWPAYPDNLTKANAKLNQSREANQDGPVATADAGTHR